MSEKILIRDETTVVASIGKSVLKINFSKKILRNSFEILIIFIKT